MRYLLPAILLLITSPAWAGEGCPLRGAWQSNEQKTLADITARTKLTEKQQAVLANGFFGRLVAEYSCTHGRTYFIDAGPKDARWAPYRVVERGEGFLVLEITWEQERLRRRFEFEGDCYRILIEKFGYEYFCRIPGKKGG